MIKPSIKKPALHRRIIMGLVYGWRRVMDANYNPLKYIPDPSLQTYFMLVLFVMWSVYFGFLAGNYWIGYNTVMSIVVHVAILVPLAFTNAIFVDAERDGHNWLKEWKEEQSRYKIVINRLKKKNLVIWGDGKAKRELMFVNDFADAFVYFMQKKIKEPFINIGIGKDFSITWYARYLMKKMKVKLNLKYDISKPNGMPRKCLDIKLAKNYGWKPKFNIDEGIRVTLSYFLKSRS